jgi:hypothetical protein
MVNFVFGKSMTLTTLASINWKRWQNYVETAGIEKIWWLVPDCRGYLQVIEDADILDLGNTARRCGNEVHIYYEHPIFEPEEAVPEPEVVTVDDEVEIVADAVNESVADVVNENVVEAEIDVNEGVVDANEGETVNED